MGNELTFSTPGVVATAESAQITKEMVKTIRDTIFRDSTDSEMGVFLHDCKRLGIHPLDRLVYPTIRKNKDGSRTYTAITSIDLFRIRADESGTCAGNDDPVFEGTPKGDDFFASVVVYKMVQGQKCPFKATARWPEYKPPAGQDFKWLQSPHIMLGKCAEALALRKAFPKQLCKIYIKEEMDHVQDEIPAVAIVRPAPAPTPAPVVVAQKTTPPAPQQEVNRADPKELESSVYLIEAVSKNGKTDRKGNTYWGILLRAPGSTDEGQWANTYHQKHYDTAKEAKKGGRRFLCSYNISGTDEGKQYWWLEEMVEVNDA